MNSFDRNAGQYHAAINRAVALSGRDHAFFTRAKGDHLRALIQGLGKANPRVLDVGCGHGDVHRHLDGFACAVTGVDTAASVVAMARQQNPGGTYDVYDGRHLPYSDARFDFVFTICVMHHVPPAQWPDFAREMHRVAAPGGMAAVFEHNPFNPLTRKVVRGCELDRDAVLLSSGRVSGLLRDVGFEDLRVRFILFTPFESAPFRLLERGLGWLPLGAQYFVTGRRG